MMETSKVKFVNGKAEIIINGKKYYYCNEEVDQYNKFVKERENNISSRIPFYGHPGGFKE